MSQTDTGTALILSTLARVDRRLDDFAKSSANTEAICGTLCERTERIESLLSGADGLVPRVCKLEDENDAESKLLGTASERFVLTEEIRKIAAARAEREKDRVADKIRFKKLLFLVAKVLTLIGLGWVAARLGLKIPEAP